MLRIKALFSIAAACGLILAVASPSTAGPASGRKPVPNNAEVAKSRQLVRSAYEEEYPAAGRSGEPTSLINALLGAADKGTDTTQQYALLLEAEQLAVQHDDAAAALAIIDRRERMFEIDGLKEKAKTLAELAGPKVSGDADLLTQSMQTARQAANAERFDIATEAINLAVSIAKSIDKAQKAEARKQVRRPAAGEKTPDLNGPALIKEAQEAQARINESKKAFTAHEESIKVLEKDPEDIAANTSVATYLCLVKQNWSAGLPYLARSKYVALAALAKEEASLRSGASPDVGKRFTLAGKWWEAGAAKEVIPGGNNAIQLHAARHYHAVLPQLKDSLELRLAKKRSEPFLNDVRWEQPTDVPPAPDSEVASTSTAESVINSIGMRLRLIPAGTFQMGSNLEGNHERPVHQVRITKPFYLGVTEVTNAQWQAVMGDAPSFNKTDDHPVEQVTWGEGMTFCKKLSENSAEQSKGLVYRLPTEAEWEYACRAGTTTRFSFGDDNAALKDHGWFGENSGRRTHAVGQKKPNPWGLHDMHGNVWEWCLDSAFRHYREENVSDPKKIDGELAILRGGSWDQPAASCSSVRRNADNKYTGKQDTKGFRVVMEDKRMLMATEVFLSDLQEQNLTPPQGHFGKHGRWHNGDRLRLDGKECPQGILLHPDSNSRRTVTYTVPFGATHFRSRYGIHDGSTSGSPLTFRVLDDNGKELAASEALSSGCPKGGFNVGVEHTKSVTLVVECPGGCGNAHAVWLDPRFVVAGGTHDASPVAGDGF